MSVDPPDISMFCVEDGCDWPAMMGHKYCPRHHPDHVEIDLPEDVGRVLFPEDHE